MPRWNSCVAEIMHRESLIMHDEKTSYLAEIYTSREDFIPRWNLCITRRIHASLKSHALQKSCIASQQLYTMRRIYASSKFAHCEKILFLAESYASREDSYLAGIYVSREYIHAPQEDIHGERKSSIYPSTSTTFFISIKENIKKSIKDNDKRDINIASIFIYLFRRQVWNALKMILQNTRHKLYLLDVRPIESTLIRGEQ